MTDEERKRSEPHAAIIEALDCLQRIANALERIEQHTENASVELMQLRNIR